MTEPPEVSDEIRKVYADHFAEINKREVSGSENFDKAVLTFSSAGLALSVGAKPPAAADGSCGTSS